MRANRNACVLLNPLWNDAVLSCPPSSICNAQIKDKGNATLALAEFLNRFSNRRRDFNRCRRWFLSYLVLQIFSSQVFSAAPAQACAHTAAALL